MILCQAEPYIRSKVVGSIENLLYILPNKLDEIAITLSLKDYDRWNIL